MENNDDKIDVNNPIHAAYIRVSDNHIVGYLSKNKLICTKIENALDITNCTASIANVANDLLKSPHPLDHHGPLTVKFVQHLTKDKYISAILESDIKTATKGIPMFIRTENSYDEFKAIALAVAQYRVDPKTGTPLDTFDELQKHGFTATELIKNNYHAEALKLVDSAIADGFKANSYSLIQTINEYAPKHFATMLGSEYFDKELENSKLKNGDLATGEVTKEGEKYFYKATDAQGNVYETPERPIAAHHFPGDNEAFKPNYNIGDKVIISPDNLKALLEYDDNRDNQAIVTRLSKNEIQGTITGYWSQTDTAGVKFNNEISYNDGAELLIAHASKNLTKTTQIQANNTSLPYLSPAEKQELSSFTAIIKHHYPEAKPETLHQLCTIASDMTKLTAQNVSGTLSDATYNSLTDSKEKEITKLLKDLPGVTAHLSYDQTVPALKLEVPASWKGTVNAIYTVPEIPKNKLTVSPEPKAAQETVLKKR